MPGKRPGKPFRRGASGCHFTMWGKGKTSLELAREILSLPGKEESLLGLYHCTRQELLQIRGVGEVKAIQLQCIGELSKRMAAAGARKGLCFHDPASIADYYMERLRHEDQEVLLCMMLDTKISFSEKRKSQEERSMRR